MRETATGYIRRMRDVRECNCRCHHAVGQQKEICIYPKTWRTGSEGMKKGNKMPPRQLKRSEEHGEKKRCGHRYQGHDIE